MGLLVGLKVEPAFELRRRLRRVHPIVFAGVVKAPVLSLPQPQDNLQGLLALLPHVIHGGVLDAIELQVGRQ